MNMQFETIFRALPDLMAKRRTVQISSTHEETLVPLSGLETEFVETLFRRYGSRALHIVASCSQGLCVPLAAVTQLLTEAVLAAGIALEDPPATRSFSLDEEANGAQMRLRRLLATQEAYLAANGSVTPDTSSSAQRPATQEKPVSPKRPSRKEHLLIDWQQTQEMWERCQKRASGSGRTNDRERATELRKLLDHPIRRRPVIPQDYQARLDTVSGRFPNFSKVIASVAAELLIHGGAGGALRLRPRLLVGPPGIGKTAFTQALRQALGLGTLNVDVGGTSAGFVLNGGDAMWSSAKAGVIAEAIANRPQESGWLVLLDEIDKIQHNQNNHGLEAILLKLLESNDLARFKDEFLGVPLDLKPLVFFMATANTLPTSDPLCSRMELFDVPAPNRQQMKAVIRSVDANLRVDTPRFRRDFAPLDDQVVNRLGATTPRVLSRVLARAYAQALTEGPARRKLRLLPRHVDEAQALLAAQHPEPPSGVSDIHSTSDASSEPYDVLAVLARRRGPGNGAPPGTRLN